MSSHSGGSSCSPSSPNPYAGGIEDGYSMSSHSGGSSCSPSSPNPYAGGIEDGYSMSSHSGGSTCSPSSPNPYAGGIEDGFSYSGVQNGPTGVSISATGGNWSNPLSWSGGIAPTASDNVIINPGVTITLDANFTRNICTSTVIDGTLICGTHTLTGQGSFTLASAATIEVASTSGISGDIKTSTYSFSPTANYIYDGTSGAQATGTGFTGANNLTINNSSGIILSYPATVTGTLTLTSGILTTTSSNILTMQNGSSTSIGSATSYINGPMNYNVAASGSSTIDFPIGASTSWRPVVLQVTHSNASSATYTGQVFNSSARALGYSLPSSITLVSDVRYWEVDRSGASNLSKADIQLYYGPDDVVTDYQHLTIAKTTGSGSPWIDIGGTASGNTSGNIVSGDFYSFSKFALGNSLGGSNPLPIELLFFKASCDNNKAQLNWATASETNNDYFTVEHSADGQAWETVAVIPGAGNSNTTLYYNVIDNQPFSNYTYYRLKQTDFNGNFTYSDIVSTLCNNDDQLSMIVFQTEYGINVSINPGGGKAIALSVFDISGKMIFYKHIISTALVISPEEFSSGIYIFRLQSETDDIIHKVMINKE
jgi:hypothetical protein